MTYDLRALPESDIVQNPVIGAYALWRFAHAYQDRKGEPPVLPLVFLVLPILLNSESLNIVLSTQKASGIALFVGKLGEQRENLVSLHERTRSLRTLTLESIIIGEQANLLGLNPSTATLSATDLGNGDKPPKIPDRIKWMPQSCDKIGVWFAGGSDHQVVRMLGVEF